MTGPSAAPWRLRLAGWLLGQWFRPRLSPTCLLLLPLSWLYGGLRALAERRQRDRRVGGLPVVVVGNLVVGGAGKTPVVIALVEALREAGWTPGVVSRGHGRLARGVMPVAADTPALLCGDEPLLIHRRTAAPVWVGAQRVNAAAALHAAHPEVDLLLCDDALQHRTLQRDVEVIVFDERGAGNGRLLPAGPLREPMTPSPPPKALVLYNHRVPTTAWPGHVASRSLGDAVPWAAWRAGERGDALPLSTLRGRRLAALAGIAVPERFFSMLAAAGLDFVPMPMPDHHRYGRTMRWPDGVEDVLTTEKDAVKLGDPGPRGPRLWVVPLDLGLPPGFVAALLSRLPRPPGSSHASMSPQNPSP